jgi:uncharacterized protein YndB with AHSA1/START domain
MIRFIHEGTRLYTHTTRAYRLFTQAKEIEKWHKEAYEIEFAQGGVFEISGMGNGQVIRSRGTTFASYEREALINLEWQDDFCFKETSTQVEVRIMSATSETEYCTEIHVLHKGLDALSDDEAAIYKAFWKDVLERMRRSVNGDWVISDSELTLDCFK